MEQMRDIKAAVPNWTAPPRPGQDMLEGRYVTLEPLDPEKHAADLFKANSVDDAIWDYLPYGPFHSSAQYHRWVKDAVAGDDPFFFAIRSEETKHWSGVASFLRISPEAGSIEAGHLCFSKELQRSRAATEAIYLMMGWAFRAGYRRFEWKCDAANLASRRAAQRLGLSFEGVFRQATIVKGRNRDTAWFAAIDQDWPALQSAFEAWLSGGNFRENGQQIERLGDLTSLVRVANDPAL